MSAFIVDANVLSELWKPNPSSNVVAWMESAEWFLPAPVIAEMQEGASACKNPETREHLSSKIRELMRTNTVVDWDGETARLWGNPQALVQGKDEGNEALGFVDRRHGRSIRLHDCDTQQS